MFVLVASIALAHAVEGSNENISVCDSEFGTSTLI